MIVDELNADELLIKRTECWWTVNMIDWQQAIHHLEVLMNEFEKSEVDWNSILYSKCELAFLDQLCVIFNWISLQKKTFLHNEHDDALNNIWWSDEIAIEIFIYLDEISSAI